MKVLMFGWEFPPHISGGLGTACYGLAKSLAALHVEVIFVVPKVWGDEEKEGITLLGASEIQVIHRQIDFEDIETKLDYYELQSELIPYLGTNEFYELNSKVTASNKNFVEVTDEGKILFNGEYGEKLFQEIGYYALVAEKLAAELDFDVIHVHDWMTFRAGIAAKRISGKPLVVHVHSTEFDRGGYQVNSAIYEAERIGLESADQVIAVSDYTRQMVIRNYYIEQEKVKTVYNAVEPVHSNQPSIVREKRKEKTVLFMGRITGQKGPEYFVEAAKLVLQQMPQVCFVMAGKGDLRNQMIAKVISLGLQENFEFPGFIPDQEVYERFCQSEIFVMPSSSEPFGIVALEAMQAGLPVVISQQSGVAEILENVLKVDYWNVRGMADIIMKLLKDETFSRKIGNKGCQEVKKLIWKDRAEAIRDVYKKIIGKASPDGYEIEK